ncbi:hypothetical protein HKK80_02785 [Halonotius sp. F2-221B]|uniref:carboxypeptidase regulatory-like domain-containing protein n=1 Tax=Halonotius sp. F2-221B TaxID=2731620 RepID=UPI00398BB2B9
MSPEARKLTHRAAILVVGITLLAVVAMSGTATAQAAGTIKGDVENAAGEGIEGADIFVDGQQVTQTESDGSFQASVNVGLVNISVDSADYERTTQTDVVVTTGETTTVDTLVPNRTTEVVTGEVSVEFPGFGGPRPLHKATNQTVPIRVEDHPDQNLIEESDNLRVETTSNENSMYNIAVPTTDEDFDLVVDQDGFQDVREPATVPGAVDITLENTIGRVNGTIRVADGGPPVQGATVSVAVDPSEWTGLTNGAITDQTGPDGNYSIQAPGGSRTVTVEAETFQPVDDTVKFQSDDTKINDFNLNLTHNVLRIDSVTPRTAQSGETVTVDYTYANDDFDTISLALTDGGEAIYTQNVSVDASPGQVSFDMPEGTTLTEEYSIRLATPRRETTATLNDPNLFTGNVLEINSVTPELAQSDDTVTVNYTYSGTHRFDTLSLDVAGDGETIYEQSIPVPENSDSTREFSFEMPDRSSVDDAQYTIRLATPRRQATGSINVANVFNSEDGEFSEDEYRSPAGDFVQIELSLTAPPEGDLDEAYILIGGDRDADEGNLQNYLDILHVQGTDQATFTVNTRLVGTDPPAGRQVYFPSGSDQSTQITSYAHDFNASDDVNNDLSGTVFEDVSFENGNGNEVATSLAEFRERVGLSPRHAPLQADRYRLVAGGSGTVMIRDGVIPDLRHPVDRSNIVLTQPEVKDVNTYVLPPAPANTIDRFSSDPESRTLTQADIGSLLDQASERDTITEGDRLLVEVQTSGMFGSVVEHTNPAVNEGIEVSAEQPGDISNNNFATLREDPEGVRIELKDRILDDPNHPGTGLQFANSASSDLYVLPDDTADQWENESRIGTEPEIGGFYMIIDTRGSDPFTGRPEDGDLLEFEIAYESPPGESYAYKDYSLIKGQKPETFDPAVPEEDGIEHYPYFGDSDTTVVANTSFFYQEPSVRYDRQMPDGDLIVPQVSDGQILGSTNIAPGSDVTLQLIESQRPNQQLVTVEDVEIDEDGRFTAEADFSELEPGQRVEIEFYTSGRLVENRVIDKRGVEVVDDIENPATFEIESLTNTTTVEQRASLDSISATIRNNGSIPARKAITFSIDGENITQEFAILQSNQTTTLDLSEKFVTLPVGEYTYTVSTEDDAATGQLTVAEPESGTVITSNENATTSNPSEIGQPNNNEATDDNGNNNDGGNDGNGLFSLIGIRSRDVAVATAVTGAIHILGYWT